MALSPVFSFDPSRHLPVSQETCVPMLKIEGNFSYLRAKPAHLVGHLPGHSYDYGRNVIWTTVLVCLLYQVIHTLPRSKPLYNLS